MAIRRKGDVAAPDPMADGGEYDDAWESAPTEFVNRCASIYIYGDTGTGRTTLALTSPGPIGLCHTAEKIDGVIQPFARKKTIRMINFGGVFGGDEQAIATQAIPIWTKLYGAWMAAVGGWARTVILDTDTEAWELLRLAKFGQLNPRGRTDSLYGPVNAEWRSLYKKFRRQDKTTIITIGQTKDEYREFIKNGQKSSERTGRTIRAGQKEVPYMADVILRCTRTDDGGFAATLEKAWFNAMWEGTSFEGKDCRLPYILSLITETDEAEWAK